MKEYGSDQPAPGGTYLNRKTWELVHVSEDGAYLKGGDGVSYNRVPALMVLALGPLAGLAFILFLPLAVPLVGVNALGGAIGRRVREMVRRYRHAEVRATR
jgi:hypothetical protein